MKRLRLVVAAVAALTLVAPATAARADPTPWTGVRCANGAITGQLTPDGMFTVTGWITPCALGVLPIEEARFRIAYYGLWSAGGGELLAYTGGMSAPTEFARALDTTQLGEPLRGACLLFAPHERGQVACVGVVLPEPGAPGVPEVVPIPVEDFWTNRPPNEPWKDQFCATCV